MKFRCTPVRRFWLRRICAFTSIEGLTSIESWVRLQQHQKRPLAEGASTITQQLAKLTHLSAEKTIRRKLEEIHLAFQIEAAYSKDEILAMYLNTVYFGRGAYGIQAAAQAYFGVDVSALTLNQSASLAAIIKAPSVYAPHINPSSNRSRRQYILSVMEDNGFITQE